VPRPPFPKTLRQFQSDFATEEACEQYLAACRWPEGFLCPRCGNRRAYELVNQRRWQCAGCRHQVSLTAGTVLHRTKTPLTHWFWAAYLMTTDKRGVSALLLQRQLGLSCYETFLSYPFSIVCPPHDYNERPVGVIAFLNAF
jgi:hypothetical protein